MIKHAIGFAAATFIWCGCNNPASEVTRMTEEESANSPLQDTLSAKRADVEARASDEKKRIYAEGSSAVESGGIRRSAKQVGDKAVVSTLPNASGAAIELERLLANAPIVLA